MVRDLPQHDQYAENFHHSQTGSDHPPEDQLSVRPCAASPAKMAALKVTNAYPRGKMVPAKATSKTSPWPN